MKHARELTPGDDEGRRLQDFDLREIDAADQRSHFALKYTGRLAAVCAAVRRHVAPGGVVLEVGCAQANASLLLAEEGFRCVALDTLEGAVQYAASRHERGALLPICARAEAAPLRAVSCDAIYVGELLEHCADPAGLLRELSALLKPGGVAIITTMNGEWFGSPDPTYSQVNRTEAANRQYGRGGEDHLFAFTAPELAGVVAEAGLRVVSAQRHASVLHSDKLMPLKRLFPPAAIRATSRFLCRLPWVGRRTALTLLVVAQKPCE
jgi:2-polyprenyl-3-methyl-5-hydroxy-6-metoxy-1,4-benzoquinol methylase